MKTKEEIKALIATAIAGQGNQVDSGGKLAEILDEIVEMASQGGVPETISISVDEQSSYLPDISYASRWGVTPEQLDALLNGAYSSIHLDWDSYGDEVGLPIPQVPGTHKRVIALAVFNANQPSWSSMVEIVEENDGAIQIQEI